MMITAVIMKQDESLIRLVQITESRLFMDISLQLIVWSFFDAKCVIKSCSLLICLHLLRKGNDDDDGKDGEITLKTQVRRCRMKMILMMTTMTSIMLKMMLMWH